MSGARCWSSSSTGGLASIWRQWWTMSQQLKWRLRVISRSTCCAKNEPAPCNVHLGGKLGIFASAVMSSALCQNLLVTCEVSGDGKTVCIHGSVHCLVVIVTVQRCHLPRDFLHVQFTGMALNDDGTCCAPGISAGFVVVGSFESDTEIHDSPQLSAASSLSSPMFDTPEFATPSPESCPLVDTPVFSTSSPESSPSYVVSEVPTTPSQPVFTTNVLELACSVASSRESRSRSPVTTISYEDHIPPAGGRGARF